MAGPRARSTSRMASRGRQGRRLEACGAQVSFGRGRAARFPAIKSKRKGRGGARVQGKERGTEGGRRGHLAVTESSSHGGSSAALRREILLAWRRYSAREQRGNGEEDGGII
jgi:hypothetical protein